MNGKKITSVSTALCLAAALSTSTAITTVPDSAYAFDLKKIGKRLNKNVRKTQKNINKRLRKNNLGKKIVTGVAAGLIIGIAADSRAAGIIAGIVVASAPDLFKKDLYNSYGQEMAWSASLTSRKKHIVAAPGQTVSDQRRKEVNAQIKKDVEDIQQALKQLGLYKLKVDGDFGPGSRAGVKEFQRSLGNRQTGILTAEERHQLFVQAEQSGYVRVAALNTIDENLVKPAAAAPVVPAIAEYRLANSQFQSFANDFLQTGSLTAVQSASMNPDGSIELEVTNASGEARKIKGLAGSIYAEPHSLTDQWARIYIKTETAERIELNTRDDFPSSKEALTWIEDLNNRVGRIALLTGEKTKQPDTQIAEVKPAPSEAPKEQKPADTETPSVVSSDGSVKAGSDGRIVLASGSDSISNTENTLTGFEQPTDTCRQNIYVSFLFPDGDDPISHYNITPPPGTIMMDNGDSTAYFTGSCVLGEYAFSYVHIDKGTTEDNWKHEKRDGKFIIDRNSEQCSINLNSPSGSAELACF